MVQKRHLFPLPSPTVVRHRLLLSDHLLCACIDKDGYRKHAEKTLEYLKTLSKHFKVYVDQSRLHQLSNQFGLRRTQVVFKELNALGVRYRDYGHDGKSIEHIAADENLILLCIHPISFYEESLQEQGTSITIWTIKDLVNFQEQIILNSKTGNQSIKYINTSREIIGRSPNNKSILGVRSWVISLVLIVWIFLHQQDDDNRDGVSPKLSSNPSAHRKPENWSDEKSIIASGNKELPEQDEHFQSSKSSSQNQDYSNHNDILSGDWDIDSDWVIGGDNNDMLLTFPSSPLKTRSLNNSDGYNAIPTSESKSSSVEQAHYSESHQQGLQSTQVSMGQTVQNSLTDLLPTTISFNDPFISSVVTSITNSTLPGRSDNPLSNTLDSGFFSGTLTLEVKGQATIDYLLAGSADQGELRIFSLSWYCSIPLNSQTLIQKIIHQILSNSPQETITLFNATKGTGYHSTKFNDVKLISDSMFHQVLNEANLDGDNQSLFSLPLRSLKEPFHAGQIAEITGLDHSVALEDQSVNRNIARDYNDIIFQVMGAIRSATRLNEESNLAHNWRIPAQNQALMPCIRYEERYWSNGLGNQSISIQVIDTFQSQAGLDSNSVLISELSNTSINLSLGQHLSSTSISSPQTTTATQEKRSPITKQISGSTSFSLRDLFSVPLQASKERLLDAGLTISRHNTCLSKAIAADKSDPIG